ncbi:MAG TPA: MBL fold metallo-hydrolase [Myxococcales bacterium]|nr:MBL fold metallo-hydrolase [Myxococcales bacterium]
MAQRQLAVVQNAPGELFVDSSCIECDTCRELAPDIFGSTQSGQSFAARQPASDAGWLRALQAVVSCPTASIGAERSSAEAARSLPVQLDGPVHRCGYSSEDSYGAQAYFVTREDGNLLIDSPRFAAPLVKRLAGLGGVRRMFLTHRDDVADHAKFHEKFGCERIIHRDDDEIGAEVALTGDGMLAPGLEVIHVPGHTRGSCVLLVDDKYLFTGDHLWAWEGRLEMGRNVSWYSWSEQKRSLRKLLDFRFEWVLPGHGRSLHLPADQMRAEVESLASRLG